MLSHDQWREDMLGAIVAAYLSRKITLIEGGQLRTSVKSDINPERLIDDTIFRTGGVIGRNNAERINGIAESFHRLNRGRDSG